MSFPDLLMKAVNRWGSIHVVAQRLGLPPSTVYSWIAGARPEPADEQRCRQLLGEALFTGG
jgi:hypothetical protein